MMLRQRSFGMAAIGLELCCAIVGATCLIMKAHQTGKPCKVSPHYAGHNVTS
jgi:hypothetical protein